MSVPPPPPEEPPPVEEELEEEELELEAEVQQVTLNQINMALNPGMAGMGTGTLGIQLFQLADDLGENLVFEINDLDEKPEPIYRIAPKYPYHLKRSGIEGRVFLVFVVDEEGKVSSARILEFPHPDFSKSALEAITAWNFHPGKKHGKSVKPRVQIPLTFSLRG